MNSEYVPSLADLPPSAKDVALAYYEAGLEHGYQLGYCQAEAQQEERWGTFARLVRNAADSPPYADLCEQRGEGARAERQRELMRRRGLSQ